MMHLGVAQLVARYLGVVEAAGSSPVTQTRKRESYDSRFSLFYNGFPHFWVRIFYAEKILFFDNTNFKG